MKPTGLMIIGKEGKERKKEREEKGLGCQKKSKRRGEKMYGK